MTGQLPFAHPGLDIDTFDELIALTRRFAAAVPQRQALARAASDHAATGDVWSELCESGLERCLLDERFGGIGLPAAALLTLVEELAAGDGGVALGMLLSNVALASLPDEALEALGQQERCTLAAATDLRETAPGRLSGTVPFVFDAGSAARLVLCTGDAGRGGTFVIDCADDGVRLAPVPSQLGLNGAQAITLTLDDALAPRIGDGELPTALLHAGIAAVARGIARRAETLARAYAEDRYQGGGPIIGHGAVRDMLARMAERRLGGAALGIDLPAALAARIVATDAAVATTTDAVQVFGGMGYMVETGVEKLMRDAKTCQLYPVSNWLARDWLLELER